MKVELKKYSCRINGNLVRIKPYAQSQNKIPLIPIVFFTKTFLRNNTLSMGSIFESGLVFDKEGKCFQIDVPRIDYGEGRIFQRRVVDFILDSDICFVDGVPQKLDCKVTLINGSYFVPLTSLEKIFDMQIKTKPPKTEPKTMNDEFTVYFPSPDFVK